ncbi:hypothetical protein U1Q18_038498 [Sarracenia purpurea var. burkii]
MISRTTAHSGGEGGGGRRVTRSEETKTNSEETNSSNQKSTRSGGDDVAEAERREQVAASGWAIDGAMLGLKMRRQRDANGETNQISLPARGATAVARAEEDDEQQGDEIES